MDNRDYNEPMNDYCSPEEERYERPLYETAEEYNQAHRTPVYETAEEYNQATREQSQYAYSQFQNNYNSNSYNSNSTNYYSSGRYTNLGGVVLDENGKPLKNSFGIKLTLSIMEMLCCCASCFTLVTGIISCIFTCQANTCYKEGRYDEYKSKSNVSTILLVVGAIFAGISIIYNAISLPTSMDSFWEEFKIEFEKELENELGYDIDLEEFWNDMMSGDDIFYENGYFTEGDYEDFYNENAVHENFEDFNQIIVNGVTVSLPCTYADLEAAGFFMNPSDLNTEIESDSSWFFQIHGNGKAYIADVEIQNTTDKNITAKEGLVVYMDFYYEGEEEKEIYEGYEFVNGLDLFATIDETLALLGEPNSGYFEESEYGYRQYYCWEYEYADGYYSYISVTFYDGVLYDIGINNGPY